MQLRLHPAESRIRKLSAEIPAEFIAFDVLLWTTATRGRRRHARRGGRRGR
jgi:ATP-dependent DNA ligase